ncbi:hypothetical protein RJ640_005028 [Escallonia rubra]|uniref:Cytochrome P450 n=1 Tax=Escallonia rubra TaxID=112253 RepID=A0AA88QRZ3_9ASTE|nr:hypothetical protein RJ640_005028 [Escallonia rubra]
MFLVDFPEILLLVFFCLVFLLFRRNGGGYASSAPTNWPLVGMIPALFRNAHRVHDFATDILKVSGGTFMLKGPWFANMDMLVTADPANIHHILSKNFSNYPKGPEFRKIFDILGDGIFNADYGLWEVHRKTTMSLMNHAKFPSLLERAIWHKVENGLIPVLEYFSKQVKELDLQEIFQRFTFDSICALVLDYDPRSLSIDLPYIPCEKAFTDTEEALLYRHILPENVWKLQKWLQVGKEKKLTKASDVFDQFIYSCISAKREELSKLEVLQKQDEDLNLLTAYMKAYKDKSGSSGDPSKFLRDTFLSLMIAGRDTTSTGLTWFFYLLSKNPLVEAKILEEIKTKLQPKEDGKWSSFDALELRKLVYLHGALCESLRLFPPVALEHKAPIEDDILPSGHQVEQNTKIVLSFYSMGRMETIWGEDCLEFKPERWISERGGIKHEPSFKFTAFNAGPRTCLGKEMAFIQMKIVAIIIIYNYHVQVVGEGNRLVSPSDSIILQVKDGLMVKLSKRTV